MDCFDMVIEFSRIAAKGGDLSIVVSPILFPAEKRI